MLVSLGFVHYPASAMRHRETTISPLTPRTRHELLQRGAFYPWPRSGSRAMEVGDLLRGSKVDTEAVDLRARFRAGRNDIV